MKYHFLFIICFFCSISQAQTAQEIVASYLEKAGGVKKLKKLKTTKIMAVIKSEGTAIPLEVYSTQSGKQAIIINKEGKRVTQFAFDGETSWTTDLLTGCPEKVLEEVSENMKLSANDFPTPFLNYREKGYRIEYVNEVNIGNIPTHKIKLIQEPYTINGKQQESILIYYFDKITNMPIKKASEIIIDGISQEINEAEMGNYRNVEGFQFPFTITESGQIINIKKIELDTEINPDIFKFPANTSN